MKTLIKQLIQNLFYPKGSKAKIRVGALKGFYYIITTDSGWAPILGRSEPEAQELYENIIHPDWVVYDLGANAGIHTMLFSKLVGKTGKVLAFEPVESCIAEIKTNASLNNLNNIEVIAKAVSNVSKKLSFKLGVHDKQGSISGIGGESGHEIQVAATSLDDFINEGHPSPDFIKVDIEGAESDALYGLSSHFDKIKPILMIDLHTKEQDKLVGEFLLKHNYELYRVMKNSNNNALYLPHLIKITDITKGFPMDDGIWGTILAFHPNKINLLKKQK